MRRSAACLLACLVLGGLSAAPAFAQAPGPPGPYVLDVFGLTLPVPDGPGIFPPTPAGTLVPGRAFGGEIGGHVYVSRVGSSRLGLGAELIWARGTAQTPPSTTVVAGASSTTAPLLPDMHATFRSLAPQVSFNFGNTSGWSYVSAGAGFAEIATTALQQGRPDVQASTGQVLSINFGGGARWFFKKRVASGFDIRFHRMSAGPATPGAMLLAAAVGVSLR